MEAIKTYINNVFSAYPQNARVAALKADMLASMEEKYHELKRQGKSENEAIGSVIANFGNMDEITAELGIDISVPTSVKDSGITLSRDEADEYISQSRKSSLWVGIGVWLILTSIAAMILVGGGANYYDFEEASVLILFAALAVAVPLFIRSGMNSSKFEHYATQKINLEASLRTELEEQSKRANSRFFTKISVGVGAILLAVGIVAVFSSVDVNIMFVHVSAGGGEFLWPVTVLLTTIGFSVLLFVTAASQKNVYDVLLGKGEYTNKKATREMENAIGGLAAVYWPVVTAIFLAWSFVGDAWDRSWVIWPVAGVLFGGLCGLIYFIQQNKNRDK